jgi:hypothetical protein
VAPAWAKEDAGVHFGRALIELDRWDEAIDAFEATYMTFPANSEALFRHLYLQHFACNFTRRTELLQEVRERMLWEVDTRGTSMMTPSQALMMLEGHELRMIAQAYAAGHLAAAAIAGALDAQWLIIMTDVEGIYRRWPDKSSLISSISASELESMKATFAEGMAPKVQACLDAIAAGAKAVRIIDGTNPSALKSALLGEGGTLVVA